MAIQGATVRVALGVPPTADLFTVDWTDISDRVVGTVSWYRGRSQVLGTIQPGRLSLTVDNSDGAFDPLNPATPFPGLRPRTPIQFWVEREGATPPGALVFTGYLDDWVTDYASIRSQDVELNATDALGAVFPRTAELSSEWEHQLSPGGNFRAKLENWYPLNERLEATAHDIGVNGEAGTHSTAASVNASTSTISASPPATRAGSTLIVGAEDPSITLSGSFRQPELASGGAQLFLVDLPQAAAPFSVTYGYSFWVQSDLVSENPQGPSGESFDQYLMFRRETTGGTRLEWIGFPFVQGTPSDFGRVEYGISNNVGTATWTLRSNAPIDDGKPHLVHVERDGADAWLYVDGVLQATTNLIGAGWVGCDATPGSFTLGGAFENGGLRQPVRMQHFVIWNDTIAPPGQRQLHHIGTSPLALPNPDAFPVADAHLPGVRIGVILDRIGWPANMRDPFLEDGTVEMKPAVWDNRTALELMRLSEQTEWGILFVEVTGRIAFVGRAWRITRPRAANVQRFFTDDETVPTSSTTHRMTGLTINHGEANLRTKVRVPWSDEVGSFENAAAIADYGTAEFFLGGEARYEADAEAVATAVLDEFSTPAPTARLEVSAYDSDSVPAVVANELLDRIEISWDYPTGPGRFTSQWTIEAISGTFGDGVNICEAVLDLRLVPGTLTGPIGDAEVPVYAALAAGTATTAAPLGADPDTIWDLFERTDGPSLGSPTGTGESWQHPAAITLNNQAATSVATGTTNVFRVVTPWTEYQVAAYLSATTSGNNAGPAVVMADPTTGDADYLAAQVRSQGNNSFLELVLVTGGSSSTLTSVTLGTRRWAELSIYVRRDANVVEAYAEQGFADPRPEDPILTYILSTGELAAVSGFTAGGARLWSSYCDAIAIDPKEPGGGFGT